MKKLCVILALALMLSACAPLASCAEAPAIYSMGDVIEDFAVVTSDGHSVTLGGLLQEYKAVVLNFWYVDCQWCVYEFPFMQQAYEAVSDDVCILALTPYDDDAAINAFKAEYGLTFLTAMDTELLSDRFGVDGYPTTVLIDRFGVICFIEAGAQSSAGSFERLFEPFIAADYAESLVGFVIPGPKPDVEMPPAAEIAAAINADGATLEYSADTDEYAWPWLTGADGARTYAYSSNTGVSETRARLLTRVTAEAGDALAFDYRVSCAEGADYMVLFVDGAPAKVFTGHVDWTSYAHEFDAAGEYDIAFEFRKYFMNDEARTDEDAAFIDNVALLTSDAARAAIAANAPTVQVLSGMDCTVEPTSPDAKQVIIKDQLGVIAASLSENFTAYIIPGEQAQFRVMLGDALDANAVNGYSNYDGVSFALDMDDHDDKGYFITVGTDSIDLTGYSWSMLQVFTVFDVFGDYFVDVLYFASEADLDAFCQNEWYDTNGIPVPGISWSYADGSERPTAQLITAPTYMNSNYTMYFVDQHGAPVAGVIANVCDETTCSPKVSGADGIVSFSAAPYPYEIHIIKVPAGYTFDTTQAFTAPEDGGEMRFEITKG